MRRLVLAALLASCGSTPKTPEERRAAYVEHMDEVEEECNLILEDLKRKRGAKAIQDRLARVRLRLQGAQKMRYRPDAEHEEMDGYFETFYVKLDQFDKADWVSGDGEKLWDKMQFQCSVCHGRFRDE